MKIQQLSPDAVKPYARNPRVNDPAVDAVARSIQEFGFRQPIVVDADHVIIVGHTRWKAAKKLGLAKVPVHVATDLSAAQIAAYRIADNKTSDLAAWDNDLLAAELADLQAADFDLEALGFSSEDLQHLASPAGVVDFADPPESVQENVRDLQEIQDARRRANTNTAEKNDTEKYLVVVYPSRAAKERVLTSLGLPADERYVPGDSVQVTRRRGGVVPIKSADQRNIKAATPAHSGRGG